MKYTYIILPLLCIFWGCEDFVEVDLPSNQVIREDVFSQEESVKGLMQVMFYELSDASYFSSGSDGSVTMVSGLASDELINYSTISEHPEFFQGNVTTHNEIVGRLWSTMYSTIYMANDMMEGLGEPYADGIPEELKNQCIGEAKFVRAFAHFYLVNLFGNVPLVTTTDYHKNTTAKRSSTEVVYEQIISDLEDAITLLATGYGGERTRPNRAAARLLLSRVYLYLGDWEKAGNLATEVISEQTMYEIIPNLDEVFKANSRETVWQIEPVGRIYTLEGETFILTGLPTLFALNPELVSTFEEGDKRREQWIGVYSSGPNSYYYPYKYKINSASEFTGVTEYSTVLRFAEAYLIRAEARAQQNNLDGAITDLDVIRERADVPLLSATSPSTSKEGLIASIREERRKELFTEWGHRWFDLVRTGEATDVLVDKNWSIKNYLYPIPEQELLINPNLDQNIGYDQ
ncbi:RagB/SusD family nutrient uptake outer membrane protein [Galbibacter sp. EGI 63066]|uniref:RagB/SusD family nutrient uptake outer membrane protein n=1 Tax=Galbibacter sp. EGI 63066 TaxID=2993559 RepID=UPI002248F720|nr:RagB/SusD family nutrient uptake outer membrane protein [Galbibacter sp. EGI 63066]MCX2681944.1 RagB/SusD family nutrient uptake outer membrane protein [Galbibacter sp. EGI 63066]